MVEQEVIKGKKENKVRTAKQAEELLGVDPRFSADVAAILSGRVQSCLLTKDENGRTRPMTRADFEKLGYDFKTVWPFNQIFEKDK